MSPVKINDDEPIPGPEYPIEPLRVGVRDAEANLSKLHREAKSGHAVAITEHERPIARLVPIGDLSLAGRLADMEAHGDLESQRPATTKFQPVRVPDGLAQKYLREDREG